MNNFNFQNILKSKFVIILFVVFVLALFFWGGSYKNVSVKDTEKLSTTTRDIKIGEKELKVEIADTQALQERGLSGREKLAEDTGMLFVFENPDVYTFWMRDMKFPIDIIWIAEDGNKVIYIEKDAKPESFPLSFGPEEKSKYVLEVVSGFTERNNIKIGDKFELLSTN